MFLLKLLPKCVDFYLCIKWVPQIPEKSIEQELCLLREELSQAQRKLQEMEEVKASECQKESEKMGRTDFIPKLHAYEEVSTMTEGGDDNLKMQLENLQNERDQLRETIQETSSRVRKIVLFL